ncbi:hypothetical protein BSKO_10038 [Bryopsis sp. KO-2023]|nr:hypothetical protein BSKO_10038 [Bryopsis sp. KO-2023]
MARSMSGLTGRALHITPSEVFFSGVESAPQSTVITVKNVNTRVRIIRVKAPQTHHVTLHGLNPTTRLAPGLEFSFEIRYDGQLEGGATFRDKITVRTETESIDIPITSVPAKPDIRIIGDLDFGIIPHESSKKKEIRLVNRGEKEGEFEIKLDEGLPLKIKPKSGTVGAVGSGHEEVVIQADLGGQEIGSVNGEATFRIDGQGDLQRVAVAGTVMKHSVQVINEHGAETQGVDFGSLFFGERAEQSLQISNNGPKEIRCVISFGNKFDMAETDEPQEEEKSVTSSEDSEQQAVDPFAGFIQTARMKAKARESGENPFTIFPLTATVEPFSSKSLKIRFTPSGHKPSKGFVSNMDAMGKHGKLYEYVGQVDFGLGGEKCRFPLKGRGVESGALIRPDFLQFGDVPTSGHAEQTIDLSNKKSDLPVKFSVPNMPPYFNCKPSQGLIPPGQSVVIIVGYCPKSFGRHQRSIPIEMHSLSGKLVRTLKLSVQGSALTLGPKRALIGGTDKLPEDFETEPMFVDDEQAISSLKMRRFNRPKLWEGKENSQLFEDIGDGTKDALGLDDHKMQLRHKDRYTEFIRKERRAKENLHLTRKESEDEVNLGMDPRSGLRSPQPKLPIKKEPLWTNPTEKSNEPKTMKPLSEDQAASVQFHKDRPDTDDEKRLCGMALSPSEITKLVMGPAIVDFGRVSASSNNTQYFFVQNTLMQPIHIVLDIKSIPEFRYTRHTSQIIPAGATSSPIF